MEADLTYANLNGANLIDAILVSALYDELTTFPTANSWDTPPWGLNGGVSPWDAGMIPVPEPSLRWLLICGASALAAMFFIARRRLPRARTR